MKLPLRQLSRHLERSPGHFYLIAGDEPLLVGEAADAVREAARREGFEDRDVFSADRSFRWDSLESSSDSLSLFAARRILEVRLNSPRPGDAGARTLRTLAEEPDPDRLVIVTVNGRLDAAAQRSVWFRTVEKHGVVVDIWPVDRAELPRWIQSRSRGLQLKLSQGAAELMADRVEGNLLAADQELQKLALVSGGNEIGEADILEGVGANARFDVFRLSDAILAGEPSRALRVLDGLRSEGVAAPLVAWSVTRDISLLGRLGAALERGASLDAEFGRLRVWKRKQPLVKKALRRLTPAQLRQLLRQARTVDRTIKGAAVGPAWPALTALVLAVIDPRSRWLSG